MSLGRREFLKWSAGTVGASLVAAGHLEATVPGLGPLSTDGTPGRGFKDEPWVGALAGRQDAAGALLFPKAEYAARRSRFMDQFPDGLTVFLGASSGPQNNEIRYFSGVEVPGTVLVLDGVRRESTLFYTTREDYLSGENLSLELATDPVGATGVEHHHPAADFDPWLPEALEGHRVLYTPFDSETPEREVSTGSDWDGRLTRRRQFARLLQDRFPGLEVRDCSEAVWEQRRFKTPAEIEATLKAGVIGASAMVEVMKAGRPGLYEYELSSLYEYTCKRQGSPELAFPTIISSAENHRHLHYSKYNRLLVDGDFLVVDAGPKWQDYCMDTTISFPINGRFSPRQREIYQACLEISKGCLARYRPGLTGYQIGEQVRMELEQKGYDLSANAFTRMRFFREGGITHYVGLETHDAGGPDLPPDRPLEAGMIFANDVFGTWPDEDLGVRIENTVVVTESGCEVLNPGIPREIEEIEALMAG
jgi:Xaa-Pro aminopeptidase